MDSGGKPGRARTLSRWESTTVDGAGRRGSESHSGGRRFEPDQLHHFKSRPCSAFPLQGLFVAATGMQ